MTETTFIAVADGSDDPPAPIKGVRRLLGWIIPANFGIFLIWGSVPGILLPQQLTVMNASDKVANFTIVATIGAFAAMIAQPAAGQISDRTRSRFGRRAPWIVLGALAGGLSLVGLAFANTLVGVAIAWTLVQITYNFAQGPLSAVLPDRVPLARRGTFAALSGIGLMVGALGGQIIDATQVPAPKQHNSRVEKALLEQRATPAGWKPAPPNRQSPSTPAHSPATPSAARSRC